MPSASKTTRPALAACRLLAEIHNYSVAHPDAPRMPRTPELNAAIPEAAWDIADCFIMCWFENENGKRITPRAADRRSKQGKPVKLSFTLCSSFYEHMGPMFKSEPWPPELSEALAKTFELDQRAA